MSADLLYDDVDCALSELPNACSYVLLRSDAHVQVNAKRTGRPARIWLRSVHEDGFSSDVAEIHAAHVFPTWRQAAVALSRFFDSSAAPTYIAYPRYRDYSKRVTSPMRGTTYALRQAAWATLSICDDLVSLPSELRRAYQLSEMRLREYDPAVWQRGGCEPWCEGGWYAAYVRDQNDALPAHMLSCLQVKPLVVRRWASKSLTVVEPDQYDEVIRYGQMPGDVLARYRAMAGLS